VSVRNPMRDHVRGNVNTQGLGAHGLTREARVHLGVGERTA